MEQEKKFFSIKQTVLSALLLGPIGGAVVVYINCRNAGKPKTGIKVIVYSVVYVLFLLLLSRMVRDTTDQVILMLGATAFNCIAAWLISESVYGKERESHTASGGGYYSSWNIVAVAAVLIVVVVALLWFIYRR